MGSSEIKGDILKLIYPGPVCIITRLEIGVPFALLNWPVSLFIGFLFAIINSIGDLNFHKFDYLSKRAKCLCITSMINTLLLTIGVILSYNFTFQDGEQTKIDNSKIHYTIMLVIGFFVISLSLRLISLGIENSLIKNLQKHRAGSED